MSAPKARVLLIEADEQAASTLLEHLERAGYRASVAAPTDQGLDTLEQFDPQVTIVDLPSTGAPGREFLMRARRSVGESAIIGLTASESAGAVSDAIGLGADAALDASAGQDQLTTVIERVRAKDRAARDADRFRSRAEETLSIARFDRIIGSHPSMQDLLKKVANVAATRATVLIEGESGTGKELIAAAIHENSPRKSGPFIRLNCAALAESVLESELFGHEKGAFTGALSRRIGRFEQADGGSLFLDEVSELPRSVQVKLLRFLQEREFERVGGNETIQVDVRIVCATNRNLRQLVQDGEFREDLYYRLAVVQFAVPPLRARPSDVLPLAQYFLRRAARENELSVTGFTDRAKRALKSYPWPGNVRELQNAVEQAAILSEQALIDESALPIDSGLPSGEGLQLMIPGVTMAELERYAITETLKATGGSATRAAKLLGISRRTIQYRIKQWGLSQRPRRDSSPESTPVEHAEE